MKFLFWLIILVITFVAAAPTINNTWRCGVESKGFSEWSACLELVVPKVRLTSR